MTTNRQTLLFYTANIQAATTEINARSGAITIRLSNSVFVASMPSSFNPSTVIPSVSLTPPNNLDEVSRTMLEAWQAVQDRDLLRPIFKRRISLARRGLAAVAVVMETDISSSAFPLVLAGAHSLAETYAGESANNKLTFAFKQFHVQSTVIGGSGPPNVPPQLDASPATKVSSINPMSSWPSAAPFNNKLFCFYRGRNANARSLFYNQYNGSSWTGEQQIPNVATSEGPSAVVFNNKLYCFEPGLEGRGEIWYASFDGNKWDGSFQVPKTGIIGGPSVAVFNNKLYCIHQGSLNTLWFNVFDGTKWEGDTNVRGNSITASPSAVVFNNLIYCFYQGAGAYEKVLMVSVLTPDTGVWGEQKPVPNSKRMSQGPSAVVVDGKLYCLHQDESEGHLYANVSSDGVEWGEDTLIEGVSMCEGLATTNFNNELYYFFQKGEGGKATDGEMWYRKLQLAEGGSSTDPEWGVSQGEPSLEELGFPAGYQGFIKLATDMYVTTNSASYGYVVYITKVPLLYDAYADETRMCLRFTEPSYIHYSFAKMFSAEGTFDQRLLSSGANFPPRPVSPDEPSYTLAWVVDWKYVLENATLLVFHRADDITANPHLWLLFLDKRNSRWVEMEGPKMSFRSAAFRGAPAPQFGPGSRIFVFYHADVNNQEMRYNVLGITNQEGEKIWDVEKVMHSIQGSNTPSALSVGQYMHVFHTSSSGGEELRYTTLDTRFNRWVEDRVAFRMWSGGSPSAVHYMGRIYLFYKGWGTQNPAKLAVSIWDKDTLTWEQATNLNAASTHLLFGEPTAVVHKNYVYVFYVSDGPNIWWNQFNGMAWTGPTRVNMAYSDVRPLDDGIEAYVWGDNIHCFFRGRGGQDGKMVFYKVFNTVDFTWNAEAILPTASGFSGKAGVILNHCIIGSS